MFKLFKKDKNYCTHTVHERSDLDIGRAQEMSIRNTFKPGQHLKLLDVKVCVARIIELDPHILQTPGIEIISHESGGFETYGMWGEMIEALRAENNLPKVCFPADSCDKTMVDVSGCQIANDKDKHNAMWTSFWFEDNQAWGNIDSPEEWERIKKAYKDTTRDLSAAQRHVDCKRYFGYVYECTGKETLGEFFDKHGMKI